MPSLGGSDVQIKISTEADSSGIDKAESSLGKLGKQADAAGALMRGPLLAGAAVAAAGVAGIGVAVVGSVKSFADYQTSLNVFQSVSSATAAQMAEVSDKAKQLGNDITLPGISASDAADAMTELAKAGLSVNDALSASKGVLSLAKAGQLDVSEAATIAARALNTFGLGGDQAGKVADLLAAGANSSTASVQDMAYALQQGGAGAKQMGVDINDTVAALAIFSNAGINGSDAGTSLKTMFQNLANPTAEASGLMKQLGLNFFDAKGNFVGLASTAGQLQDKLGKLSVEQKNQALATIFGSDSSRVAAILADTGAASFDKMRDAVSKSGAATDLAAAQNSGLNGSFENLKSTLETAAINFGEKLAPTIQKVADYLSKNLPAAIDTAFQVFENIKNAVKGFFDLLKNNEAFRILMIAIGAFIVIMGVLITVLAIAGIAMAGFALLAAPITVPMLLIAAAIAAVIAIGILLVTHWNDILNVGKTVFGAIGSFVGTVAGAIGGFFAGIWNTIVGVFNAIVGFIQQWGMTILAIIFWPFTLLAGLFITFHDQIMGFLGMIWDGIVAIFTPIVQFYAMIFGFVWTVITNVWNGIVSYFQGVWNMIVTIFSAVGSFFHDVFTNAWNIVVSVFSPIIGWFQGIWNSVVSIFGSIGSAIGGAISGAIKGVLNAVIPAAIQVINGIIGGIDTAIDIMNRVPGVRIGKINPLPVPKFASGANYTVGGMALVGENGPEYVNLPRGSQVYNNKDTSDMMRSGGDTQTITIQQMNLTTGDAVRAFFDMKDRDTQLTSMGLTPARGY